MVGHPKKLTEKNLEWFVKNEKGVDQARIIPADDQSLHGKVVNTPPSHKIKWMIQIKVNEDWMPLLNKAYVVKTFAKLDTAWAWLFKHGFEADFRTERKRINTSMKRPN